MGGFLLTLRKWWFTYNNKIENLIDSGIEKESAEKIVCDIENGNRENAENDISNYREGLLKKIDKISRDENIIEGFIYHIQ